MAAARKFNTGRLRYTWIQYLPIKPPITDFFKPLKQELLQRLSNEAILESRDGKMARPTSLTYVPERFTDSSGNPFTSTPNNECRYLSKRYLHSDREYILPLGIKEMSVKDFLQDLEELINGHTALFQNQSLEWHTQLSEVLVTIVMDPKDSQYLPSISALQLIPLRDGRWISGRTGTVLFPGGSESCVIPEGIDLLVVHSDAVDSTNHHGRRMLFSLLGVKQFSAPQICLLIFETHQDPSFNPRSVSRKELVSQTVFLYTAQWSNTRGLDLWYASENDGRFRGAQIYMDSDEPYAASRLLGNHRDRFHFLHSDYISAVRHEKERWLEWLRKTQKLSILPRLVQWTTELSFDLSSDFEFLTQVLSSAELLLLLRDNWSHYVEWIGEWFDAEDDNDPRESRRSMARVRSRLASLKVKCHGGSLSRLDQTFLPLDGLMEEASGCIPFLDIPEPADRGWQPLLVLGVGVCRNVCFYLRCLENVFGSEVPLEKVSTFYDGIEARHKDSEKLVR